MHKRYTILETVKPVTEEFAQLASKWHSDFSKILLGWIWAGYDLLKEEILSKTDWSLAKDDLEREISEKLERRIRRIMPHPSVCDIDIQHEPKERETRESPPAQPPEYDIVFIINSNERIMWPIEAKILKTDGSISEYVKDIRDEFLTCRYAPFSSEGAMLGYMLSGKPAKAFSKIEKSLGIKLSKHPDFINRDHRQSSHIRNVEDGKSCPENFCCHHLMMLLKI